MTFLRKRRLDINLIDDNEHPDFLNIAADTGPDVLELKSKMAYVNSAINQFLPDDSAILTLFYQGEQSLEEIGKELNMETNTVKVKLHRARLRLKVKLEFLLNHEVEELL